MGKAIPEYDLLVILGPTATGKTALAAHLAAHLGGEVISADSRQVYRDMNIGTGKDLEDYEVNGVRIPVHLTDIVDAGTQYNVFEYKRDFQKVISDLLSREKFPVLCGGSGLYIEAVLKDYRLIEVPLNGALRARLKGKSLEELAEILKIFKPHLHNITDIVNEKRAIRAIEIEEYYLHLQGDPHTPGEPNRSLMTDERLPITGHPSPNTTERSSMTGHPPLITDMRSPVTYPQSQTFTQSLSPSVSPSLSPTLPHFRPLVVGIHFDVETRRRRITERLHQRLSQGMIEEVEGLLRAGIAPEALTYYGLEYKFITFYLTGELSLEEMTGKLNIAIHQFAKRQMTWFRKMEREGTVIHWIDGNLPLEEKIERVTELLEG